MGVMYIYKSDVWVYYIGIMYEYKAKNIDIKLI